MFRARFTSAKVNSDFHVEGLSNQFHWNSVLQGIIQAHTKSLHFTSLIIFAVSNGVFFFVYQCSIICHTKFRRRIVNVYWSMIYRTHKKTLNHAMFLADNLEANRLRRGKLGKDPTVETGFLPDRYVWHLFFIMFPFYFLHPFPSYEAWTPLFNVVSPCQTLILVQHPYYTCQTFCWSAEF